MICQKGFGPPQNIFVTLIIDDYLIQETLLLGIAGWPCEGK